MATLGLSSFVPSISVHVIFLALSVALWFVGGRRRRQFRFEVDSLVLFKQVVLLVYAALQLGRAILTHFTHDQPDVVATASVAFLAALVVVISPLFRDSSILTTVYLVLSTLVDLFESGVLVSDMPSRPIEQILLITSLGVRIVIVVLEFLSFRSDEAEDEKEEAHPATVSSFFWPTRLLQLGYRSILNQEDLDGLDGELSSHLLSSRLQEKLAASPPVDGSKFRLAKALARTLRLSLVLPMAPRLVLIAFRFCQPFLLDAILTFLSNDETNSNPQANAADGFQLVGWAIFVYSGIAFSNTLYWYLHQRFLCMARGCLVGAMLQKTVEVDVGPRGNDQDELTWLTLMSTDIERIELGFEPLHEYWASTIECIVGLVLLERRIGVACLLPLAVVGVCVTVSWLVMGGLAGRLQERWMTATEQRVSRTADVVGQMTDLCISGSMASAARAIVLSLRTRELKAGLGFRMVQAACVPLAYMPVLLSPVVVFAVTSSVSFVTLSYIVLLAAPLTQLIQVAPETVAGFTCLARVQNFLQSKPHVDFRLPGVTCASSFSSTTAIHLVDAHFGWDESRYVLSNVNLAIPARKLTLILGSVGCGKTTLCKGLLGEVPLFQGRLEMIPGATAYCDQNPFLVNSSLRDNIVMGAHYNAAKYAAVLQAAALEPDLAVLGAGDATFVGPGGLALSGGQKQRVCLARALYADSSSILILDEPLSGLDPDTQRCVFERAFGGDDSLTRHRDQTVVLCTNSPSFLPQADYVVILGPDGALVDQGEPAHVLQRQKIMTSFTRQTERTRTKTKSDAEPHTLNNHHLIQFQQRTGLDREIRQMEAWTMYQHYFATVNPLYLVIFLGLCLLFGFLYNFPQIWLKFWSAGSIDGGSESFYLSVYAALQVSSLLSVLLLCVVILGPVVGQAGTTLHARLFDAVHQAPLSLFSQVDAGTVTNLFSQDMTLLDEELPVGIINVATGTAMGMGMVAVAASASLYMLIIYPTVVALLFLTQKFYVRTSKQLKLIDLEAKTPLYAHFADTAKGIATMRAFGTTGAHVARGVELLDMSQRAFYALSMVQHWLDFAMGIVLLVVVTMLVAVTTTLRSNAGSTGASIVALMSFGETLSNMVKYYTLLEAAMCAAGRLKRFDDKWVDGVGHNDDIDPPDCWPQNGVITIRDVSASYVADPASKGSGEKMNNACGNLCLNNINATFEAGEKVAICGRTGSGKSSLMRLLLRSLEPLPPSGAITIDDIPLGRIAPAVVRERVIAIPQDAVFLPVGTSVRLNLDPSSAGTDDDCRAALDSVRLWGPRLVESLDGEMARVPLSQGQKQLFCLARAVLRVRLRKKKEGGASKKTGGVLLLDELGSVVDEETERVMLDTLRREFDSYTVVMVAHRLELAARLCSRVIFMTEGRITRVVSPREVLEEDIKGIHSCEIRPR